MVFAALGAWAATLTYAEPASTPVSPAAQSGAAAAPADGAEKWLTVTVNGQPAADTVLVLGEVNGKVWVRGEDLGHWRLPVPQGRSRSHQGESYYPLDALAGLSYHVDEPTQALLIEAPARLFDSVNLTGTKGAFKPIPPPPLGGFFNYDGVVQTLEGISSASALLEGSVFGRAGAVVTRFLERYQKEVAVESTIPARPGSVRLESTWTLDRPQSAASLRLGDSITGASRWWGGAVRFGGIQWASNFATRPELVTLPLPTIGGESALPSTLELYVNDALKLRENVPGGPFTVQDVPVVTGDGQIRLVVRDLLGREQVITQSYYSSPRLLRPGLHEYSFELGAVRENFGLESNDYGRMVLVGTDRVGLSESVTGEVHAEVLEAQQTLGFAASSVVPHIGVASAALAGSHSEAGAGYLASLGFERAARRFNFGINAQMASAAFVRVGLREGETVPRLMGQVFANLALGRFGSVSVLGARQSFRDRLPIEIVSIRHSVELRGLGYLSASALRTLRGTRDTLFNLSFTRALGSRRVASTGFSSQADGTSTQVQLQQGLPAGTGFGYRVRADAGTIPGASGSVAWQNDIGTYQLEGQTAHDVTLARAGASGGLAFLDGRAFASRQIDSSFAVAQVGTEPNVRIYRDNQLVGRTDDEGYVILPGLRPYQQNLIRIEQADLPLDVAVNSVQAGAIPYFRSGVVVRFPIERARGALLTVMLENGTELPPGTLIHIEGNPEEFPAGMGGEVYVTGLAAQNRLAVSAPGLECAFDLPFAPNEDPLPHLGTFVCKRGNP